jgi:hypothetical protein
VIEGNAHLGCIPSRGFVDRIGGLKLVFRLFGRAWGRGRVVMRLWG